MQRYPKKIFDTVVGYDRIFYWGIELLRRMISGDRPKEHMGIIMGKMKIMILQ